MRAYRLALLLGVLSMAFNCDTIPNHFSKSSPSGPPPNPLAAPTNLQGQCEPGGQAIDLSWTNNASGETGYAVLMSTGPIGSGSSITQQTIAADSTAFTWTGLATGQVYYFEVSSINSGTLSLPSNMISVSTAVPVAPTNLVANAVSPSEIDLSWTASVSAGVTGYRIERSTDLGTTWNTLVTVPITTYKDTALSEITYSYRVFAVNANGDSFPTPIATATPMNIASVSYSGSTDFGKYTSIVVGATGTEYVASYDNALHHALYTTGTRGGSYTTVPLDTSSDTTGLLSTGLDLDSTGTPNLAYQVIPPSTPIWLNWATPPPAAPSIIEQSSLSVGQSPRLQVAPDNTIHVVAYDEFAGYNQWRHFIHPPGGTWTVHSVSATTDTTSTNSANYLDLDSSGNPAMVYTVLVNQGTPSAHLELTWAAFVSGLWTTAPIVDASGGASGSTPAFALDAAGHAHVVYVETSQVAIGHATNASGNWVIETIATVSSGSIADWPAIAIDKGTGRVHVVFAHSGNNGLQYVRQDPGGAWVLLTLDPNVVPGSPSIAVDGTGVIHVAYYDTVNKRLKIASGMP